MGMGVDEFYDMLPIHFFNKMDGFFEMEQLRERNEWDRCRWQTAYLVNIHLPKGKGVKLTDLVKFDWEQKDAKINYEKLKAKAEYIKKMSEHGK